MLKNSGLFFIWFLFTVSIVKSQSDSTLLTLNDSVIDIGYGKNRIELKSSAVTYINAEQFNTGINITPIELIISRVPGMLLTRESGTPGSNFDVTIRGKSALFSNDNPLYVIDGIPLDHEQIDGMRNPLNFINPGDIESFTVLKDAAALAIYGGRASNGVILINTKKGISGKPLWVNYETKLSISLPVNRETLSADNFRTLIETRYADQPQVITLLGESNTNWQDEITKNAFGQDHLLSITGGVNKLPYRVSMGYTKQDGVLKTDQFKRFTTAININPRFFKDHLRIGLGIKGMLINNQFADSEAISGAVAFDPTQNVYDEGNPYGGYFYWKDESGYPLRFAAHNPLAKLELTSNESAVSRLLWFVNIDYKFHFLPELKIALKYSDDRTNGERNLFVPDYAPWYPNRKEGENNTFNNELNNSYYEALLTYNKRFERIHSSLDVLFGSTMQSFENKQDYQLANADESVINAEGGNSSTNNLASIFGRINFSFKERYILGLSFRRDGYSMFSEDNRWSNYPAISLGWNMHNETFISNSKIVSIFRLRISYGKTGNFLVQHEPFNIYPYGINYSYDPRLIPETTKQFNLGLDYGFLNKLLYGSIEFYVRNTSDMMNLVAVPDGTNLTSYILTNAGEVKNSGFELSIFTNPVSTNKINLDIGLNITYNVNKVEGLGLYERIDIGAISGGVGNSVLVHSIDYPAYSFFVFEQIYDNEGNPVEGMYVDRNNDGEINSEDRYNYKTPIPSAHIGITGDLRFKNWDFSFLGTLRLGNYVYNYIDARYAAYNMISPMVDYLNSTTPDIYNTQFEKNQNLSDYYVQNASFFRLNYLRIGFDFSELIKGKWGILVYTTAKNLFTISAYKGPEPQIIDGIDYSTYPSPRTFLLGVNVRIN